MAEPHADPADPAGPVHASAADVPASTVASAVASGSSHANGPAADPRPQVLLVDDEPASLRVLVEALRERCRIKLARDGEQALALCRALAPRGELPDMVVADVLMPGLDGYGLGRALRADPLTRALPLVYVTLQPEACAEVERLQLGAVDVITKPVHPAALRLRVANLVALKRLQDRAAALATHDELTGLANRRHFEAHLQTEWRRAERSRSPLALLRVDVDGLAAHARSHGHPQSQEALRRIGQVVGGYQQRPGDLAARLDADDFALVLGSTDAVGAMAVADAVHERVARLPGPAAREAGGATLTVSIGVAVARPGLPLDDLRQQAEGRLAQAKQAGGNRVVGLPAR